MVTTQALSNLVPVQVMLDAYNRGEIDEIYMVYNKFCECHDPKS